MPEFQMANFVVDSLQRGSVKVAVSPGFNAISGRTRVLGVFGCPVEHSLSPAMHNAALTHLGLDYTYLPFSVRPEALECALHSLTSLGIVGVNLTIPHKESGLAFVDEVTDEAEEVGAINTVHCLDGRLIADNTDGLGFYRPLTECGFKVRGKNVVVLGAGGAARSVVFRLSREGAKQIWIANRSRERADNLMAAVLMSGNGASQVATISLDDSDGVARAILASELLVQTTRLGMYPDVGSQPPLPADCLHRNLLVYDLVYNPIETSLMAEARLRGCTVLGGVKMLVYQGAAALERWIGTWPPTDVMERAVVAVLQDSARAAIRGAPKLDLGSQTNSTAEG